jgi:hypothetical protein
MTSMNGPETQPICTGIAQADNPNPHLAWVVEYGAIDLPLGHPSRITVLSIHHSEHDAASALYEATKEYRGRMWPISLQVDGRPDLSEEIASRDADAPSQGDDEREDTWQYAVQCAISHLDYWAGGPPPAVGEALRTLRDAFLDAGGYGAPTIPYGPNIPVEHWSELTQRIDDVLEQYASPSHVLQLLRDLRPHVAARVQAKVDANLARYMPHTAKKMTNDNLAD